MRNTVLGILVSFTLLSIILVGCSSGSSAPTQTTKAPPVAATTAVASPPAPSTTPSSSTITGVSSAPALPPASSAATNYPIPFNPAAQTGGTMIINHNAPVSFISAPADGPQLPGRIGRAVFEPLLVCDESENIQPWLATSFTTSSDGKVITLKLRQGVKFTDGTDFNAEAVKFNLDLDLKNNISGSTVLKKITSYNIPDPYTITLNFSSPDATFLLSLAQGTVGLMASPTAQQKPTTADNITEVHCVGTGPFIYDSWKRDSYVQFKANPNYWQKGKPYLSVLRFNTVTDQTASLLAFRSGQANVVITLDPVDAVALKKDGFSVGITPETFIHSVCPDGNNPDSPFTRLEVRQALEYSLNKAELVAVGSGFFNAATQFAKPNDGYYDSTIVPRSFDLAKARQLLTAAGYPNGIQTIVVSDQSIRVDIENLILAQLKAAGFNITKVDVQTSAAYTTTTQKGWKSGTAGVGSILMPGRPTADNLISLISRFNTPGMYPDQYIPAGWADAWNAVQGQVDTAKRNAQVKAMIRQMFDTASIIPYQFDNTRFVTDSKVQGWSEYFQANNGSDFYQPGELWLKTK
jgi:ABC-type transport system substrate-binding protein